MVSKYSDFWVCALILNSHWVRAGVPNLWYAYHRRYAKVFQVVHEQLPFFHKTCIPSFLVYLSGFVSK